MLTKTKIASLSVFSALGLFFASIVQAVCPVCTVGVFAGLGLARWLNIDDTVTGLWIGGAVVFLIMWTLVFFDKKNIKFPGRNILTIIISYILIFWPLFSFEGANIGHPNHTIWKMDKLIFSVILGSLALFGFEKWYRSMRAKRGKSLFRYQKVVWPILPLVILSIFFYFVTRYELFCCYQ